MKKIKWKPNASPDYARAEVGCVVMYANLCSIGGTKRWFGDASVKGIKGCRGPYRQGSTRKSIAEAKEDAVQLAREILFDYYTCLQVEMANFDLVECNV